MKDSHLKGKTAFITGASSGIGKACAEKLASAGVHLILCARRLERLEALAKELSSKYDIHVRFYSLDVQKKSQIDEIFETLKKENVSIDILINNAGLALSTDKIQDALPSNWDIMIDTNIKGLLYITHAALPFMTHQQSGHIVNIGSVAGHDTYIAGNIYCMTKYAVRAFSKCLRLDLLGTPLRVSEIAPGAVETEFSEVRWNDKERAKKFYEGFIPLSGEDIADAVFYCVSAPTHVNVAEVVLYPQAQASVKELFRRSPDTESNPASPFITTK